MFGLSFEHFAIIGVILLFFGPKRLPELGQTMGQAIKNFKDSISGISASEKTDSRTSMPALEASPSFAHRSEEVGASVLKSDG